MADNNFRSYRGRDAGAPPRSQPDDPLAELARLIGQSEPATDYDRDARGGPSFDQPASDLDWAAEDRYAQPREPAEADYDAPDEPYAPAQHADLLPTFRPGAPSYDDAHEPPASRPFSPPARSLNGTRDYALPERARFHDEQEPVQSVGRQPPGFLSQLPDDRDYDYPPEQGGDDQAYALEDYEEEAPAGRRRTGLVVVAAVLGLAVLGTAGAFAYRAMFGSSMLPSLPPIIKADDGPNKIVPNKPKSTASDQADASATSGEKLVSREEQPVDVPAPANSAPRVVSTIPIFPDPNSGRGGFPGVRFAAPSTGANKHGANRAGGVDMAAGPKHRARTCWRHAVGWAGRDASAHAEKGPHRHHPDRSDGVDDCRCLDRAGDAVSCASPGARPHSATSCRHATGAAGARAASGGQWPAVDRSQSGRRCVAPCTHPHRAGASG